MENHSGRSSRKAILTPVEIGYISGKYSLSTKKKSKLFHDLNERFDALLNDLTLINNSTLLEGWRAFLNRRYRGRTINPLVNHMPPARELHLSIIRSFKKNKKRYFWLDTSPHEQKIFRIDERAFNEGFVLRKLKLDSNRQDPHYDKLINAYKKKVLPYSQKEAITHEKIQEIVEKGTNPNVKKITSIKLKQEDPKIDKRVQEIMKIVDRQRKIMDKKLAKYNSRIIQIQPELN